MAPSSDYDQPPPLTSVSNLPDDAEAVPASNQPLPADTSAFYDQPAASNHRTLAPDQLLPARSTTTAAPSAEADSKQKTYDLRPRPRHNYQMSAQDDAPSPLRGEECDALKSPAIQLQCTGDLTSPNWESAQLDSDCNYGICPALTDWTACSGQATRCRLSPNQLELGAHISKGIGQQPLTRPVIF